MNQAEVKFRSISENEAFARMIVSAFIAPYDPTVGELTDIKTVVSEAVTNAIIHGYHQNPHEWITMKLSMVDQQLSIEISDQGAGMSNVDEAMQPLFTSLPDQDRSGMGFTIMEHFMDHVTVDSTPARGTTVILTKKLQPANLACH